MKNVLVTVTLVSAVGLAQLTAQEHANVEDTDLRHVIGLNATGLLNHVLNSDQGDDVLPYLFAYQLHLDRLVLRAGLGPAYATESVVHEGFTDQQETTHLDLAGRLGAGLLFFEQGRWTLTGGVDLTVRYILDESIDDTGFDRITDEVETFSFGGGPFLQLGFRVSDRISLATESALYARRYKTTHTELFENFPDFNNQLSKATGTQLDTFLPTVVFVHIHF